MLHMEIEEVTTDILALRLVLCLLDDDASRSIAKIFRAGVSAPMTFMNAHKAEWAGDFASIENAPCVANPKLFPVNFPFAFWKSSSNLHGPILHFPWNSIKTLFPLSENALYDLAPTTFVEEHLTFSLSKCRHGVNILHSLPSKGSLINKNHPRVLDLIETIHAGKICILYSLLYFEIRRDNVKSHKDSTLAATLTEAILISMFWNFADMYCPHSAVIGFNPKVKLFYLG